MKLIINLGKLGKLGKLDKVLIVMMWWVCGKMKAKVDTL